MFSLKRLSLLMLPAVLMLLVAACGDDPTPTSPPAQPTGPTPTPTFAPRPTPTPTVTPTPAPAPQEPITWVINRYEIENESTWEVRIGGTAKWGYSADDRVNGNEGDGIVMTIRLGDSIYMEELRSSSSGNTRPHNFTIVDLGIDEVLPPGGRFPFTITPEAVGEYIITDSSDPTPGEHGNAKIVVIEAGTFVPGSGLQLSTADFLASREEEEAGEEGIIDIDAIRYEDGSIELRIGPNPRLGYEANARISSSEGDGWIIKLAIGDKLIVGRISQSGSRSSTPHSFTIPDLGVNFPLDELEAGGNVEPWTFTFLDEGAYAIVDAHGDDHGSAMIIVGNPVLEGPYRPVTYTLDQVRIRDTVFELRTGPTAAWGYAADTRVRSDDGANGVRDVDEITITINVGDSLVFPTGLTSSSGNTSPHFFTIDELGIDIEVPIDDGDGIQPGFTIAPTEAGTYLVYCSAHPDAHGASFAIVVNEPPAAVYQPVTYTLDQVRVRDTVFELRTGPTAAWGYTADTRVRSDDGANGVRDVDEITITINVGDSLVFPTGLTSSSGNTSPHFFTIDDLGIDIEIPIDDGDGIQPGFTIAPTEAGTYLVYCSAHPDAHGAAFTIVVNEPPSVGGPEPVVYTLDKIRIRDGLFDVRMGDTTAWGYDAGSRNESGPYEGNPGADVFLVINLGDSIVFEDGIDGSNGNAETHFFTVDDLGIDIELAPGTSTDPGFTLAPSEAGTYKLYCSAHPDDHGLVFLVVVDQEAAPASPATYTLNMIRIRDGLFDVRMGDTAYWGYDAGQRVESGAYEGNPGQDVFLTINVGDSIVLETSVNGSNGNAETHFLTIDGLGIDLEFPPGTATDPGYTLAPTEAGIYRIYCSAHPDDHGNVFLIVQ